MRLLRRRRELPCCAGCRRRIRNTVYLIDIHTHQSWHTRCRDGAVTS